MLRCKYKPISFLILLLVSYVSTIPVSTPPVSTVTPDHYTIKENYIPETTTTPKIISSTPISELIQLQTDAIKKILSTSIQTQNFETSKPTNKCEDIESGIKESIRKSSVQEDIIIKNIQKQESQTESESAQLVSDIPDRGDQESDKNLIPNARTLFSMRRNDENVASDNNAAFIPDNQNIILVPCIKRITQNPNSSKEEDLNPAGQQIKNYKGDENDQLIHSIDSNPKYVLEKVYSPNGYLLYYMYRPRNNSPEQPQPPLQIAPTPPPTTTTTTPTPSTDMYQERLKFVIQVPYAEPEQVVPQGYRFDQYAYYPKELQPAYVNGPVPYSPTFHMIRTLIIPNEYRNQNAQGAEYLVNGQQNYENNS